MALVAGTSKPKVPIFDRGISAGPCTVGNNAKEDVVSEEGGGGGSQVGRLTKSLYKSKWLRPLVAPSCKLSLVVNSKNIGSELSTT